jgi:hypothetical protein
LSASVEIYSVRPQGLLDLGYLQFSRRASFLGGHCGGNSCGVARGYAVAHAFAC